MGAPKLRVEFTDGTSRDLRVGAFAQIAAKRRFGLDMLKEGDPEAGLYSAWIELQGPPPAGDGDVLFDAWLKSVAGFELAVNGDESDDDADPTVAESSGSSLASPPISESTPSD